MARGNGHEVMLDLPMEPATYPDDDPGPQALMTQLDERQNQQRLRWVIGRAEGYVGLAVTMGSRFTGSEPHLKPILREIKAQGLMFLDNQLQRGQRGCPRCTRPRPSPTRSTTAPWTRATSGS